MLVGLVGGRWKEEAMIAKVHFIFLLSICCNDVWLDFIPWDSFSIGVVRLFEVYLLAVDSSVLLKDSRILVVVISRLLMLLLLLLLLPRLGPSLFIFHSSIWLHLLFCRTLITLFIFFLYLSLKCNANINWKIFKFAITNFAFPIIR